MKNGASKFRIFRTSTSPYFPADFNLREKKTLEAKLSASNKVYEFEFVESMPCDFLITNTHTKFSTYTSTDLESLKLIIHPNSGYDNFPASLVENLKADVIIGSTIRAQAVAQYILSAFFNHHSPVNHQSLWSRDRKSSRGLISDLKVTIIGHGHIGKIISSCLIKMVKNLTIIDNNEGLSGDYAGSDVIILACGLNSSSRHMINTDFLKSIKADALIINAARGELIKTDDIIDFLKTHPRAFAVLDVFENEPEDLAKFQALPNVITTSHIAGVYQTIDQATIDFEKKVITDFLTMKNFKESYQPMILKNRLKAEGLI